MLSCNAQETPHTQADVDIKEGLKTYLLSRYDDIKISEVYSKNDNKKDYLEKSLGLPRLTPDERPSQNR